MEINPLNNRKKTEKEVKRKKGKSSKTQNIESSEKGTSISLNINF